MLQKLMPAPYKVETEQPRLDIKLKPNQAYAVIAQDYERYYRAVMIKRNDFTNGFSLKASNPAMGVVQHSRRMSDFDWANFYNL